MTLTQNMNLPPEAIAEFRQIFYQEHGTWLSHDDAHRLAHELYTLGRTLVDMAQKSKECDHDEELPSQLR